MKKLILTAILLFAATWANAMQIGVGDDALGVGETTTISIYGNGSPANVTVWLILESDFGDATNSGGTMLYPGDMANMTHYTNDDEGILSEFGSLGFNTTDVYGFEFFDTQDRPLDGILVDDITFDAGNSFVAKLTLVNIDNGLSILDERVIFANDIPEPMTFVLLGLGGIMLRRKKR